MSALQTGGGASPPSFEGSLLPGTPHQTGATYQSYLEGGLIDNFTHAGLKKKKQLIVTKMDWADLGSTSGFGVASLLRETHVFVKIQ